MQFAKLCLGLLCVLMLSSCSDMALKANADENRRLNQLVENYSPESLEFSPLRATYIGIAGYDHLFVPAPTAANRAKTVAFEQRYLEKIQAIDPTRLSGSAYWTYQIFKRDRERSVKANRFPFHYFPFNQMYGLHNSFAELGSGDSAQKFNTAQDFENFMSRAKGFAKWAEAAIDNMREGMEKGYVFPRPIVEKILPQLKAHMQGPVENSIFYRPLTHFPEQISARTKERIAAQYRQVIVDVIMPTYRKLYEFMQGEYLAKARLTVGLSQLPEGEQWYQFLLQGHTTLDISASEIHEFGLQEVARIRAEMNKVREQLGFKGDLQAFFKHLRESPEYYFSSEQELVEAYKQVKKKIESKLPKFFNRFPKAPYEVRLVPKFRQASSAGAYYNGPSADGSRPGIFYINSYNLKAQPKFIVETLSIHEAAPGHHFQIALQQELDDLPSYRRFGGYTVFAEGWALYTESLGKEMGLFSDPMQWYGRLSDEQLRAMRLVVDTGLHALGWSREKAIDYMLDNSSMAKSDIEAEVERYIVIPGQAVSYKIGERFIRQLRRKAEQALAERFDIREFHTQVLEDGQLPMPLLEEKIDRWIKSQQSAL